MLNELDEDVLYSSLVFKRCGDGHFIQRLSVHAERSTEAVKMKILLGLIDGFVCCQYHYSFFRSFTTPMQESVDAKDNESPSLLVCKKNRRNGCLVFHTKDIAMRFGRGPIPKCFAKTTPFAKVEKRIQKNSVGLLKYKRRFP